MHLALDKSPASKALQLFVLLNKIEISFKVEDKISIETKDGKLHGPITVARYLNSLSKDKSFIQRKDEFEYALVSVKNY